MPGTTRYRASVNEDLEIRVLDILSNSQEALSIQQMQREDIILAHHTSQKITRVLAKLIEMGFVRKGKSKSSGHMMYKAVSVMLEQGYSVDDDPCGLPGQKASDTVNHSMNEAEFLKNFNVDWELEAEKC